MDLSTLCAATRGKRKKPVAAEITTPVAISMIMFRRRRVLGAGVSGVARIPCDVMSNAHARIRAIGNPTSSNRITRRSDQFGNSHAGKVAEASWMMPPAAMM